MADAQTGQHDSSTRSLTVESLKRAMQMLMSQPALPPGPTPERPFVLQLVGQTYICKSMPAWNEAFDDACRHAVSGLMNEQEKPDG